ncbi:hypothetical protein V2J09_021201 [Rumex salicifolius]
MRKIVDSLTWIRLKLNGADSARNSALLRTELAPVPSLILKDPSNITHNAKEPPTAELTEEQKEKMSVTITWYNILELSSEHPWFAVKVEVKFLSSIDNSDFQFCNPQIKSLTPDENALRRQYERGEGPMPLILSR